MECFTMIHNFRTGVFRIFTQELYLFTHICQIQIEHVNLGDNLGEIQLRLKFFPVSTQK